MAKFYRIKYLIAFFISAFSGHGLFAQVNAAFSSSSTQGCAPLTVQFRDNSTGSPSQWYWDFGNDSSSAEQNPAVTFSASGIYTVTLIVRNSGSQDYEEKVNYITVFATPATSFITSADSGCAPLQVRFTNTTSLFNATLSSWLWNFGDGATSTGQNPAHVFANRGRFDVSLTASTAEGCVDTMKTVIITGNQPAANFSASPLDGCASPARNFTNTSSGNLTYSNWTFGDGGLSQDINPQYYYQDTGWFSVKLVAGDNGCLDSVLRPRYMHVIAPIPIILMQKDCNDRYMVKFLDKSIAETGKRKWDLGDGTFSIQQSVVHTYTRPGTYIIKLDKTTATCASVALDTLIISDKKPILKTQPARNVFCRGDSIQFFVTNYEPALARTYAWDLIDTSIGFNQKQDTVAHVYKRNGNYRPVAYFADIYGCVDTISLSSPITIKGPTADFNYSGPDCRDLPINFEDRSAAGNQAPITRWIWNFDDGIVRYDTSLVYRYAFPLLYNVNLLVQDADGCQDSIYHSVEVSKIPNVDAGPDTTVCAGQATTLTPGGASSSYVWTNANGLSCTRCEDPVAKPAITMKYFVTGSDSSGCSSQDSVVITVQQKQQVSVLPAPAAKCAGDSIQLQASGTDNYSWTPATSLNNPGMANPIAFPIANTTYIVTGKDKSACFADTAMISIEVNPKPFINLTDSIVKLLAGSNYLMRSNYSEDVRSWQWLPVTGLSCSNCPMPVASVKDPVTYTVNVSNVFGCSSTDAIIIIPLCTQQVLFVPNTFSPNNDGMNDYFFPRSNNNIFIKAFKVFNRWGQTVFEKTDFPANNYTYGWDGKFNKIDQKSDVYVYMMEVECANGTRILKKGDVTLIR